MNWIIPGTTLEGLRSNADRADELFHPMFLAGGLTLSQVVSITGLETHTVQNWIKRGFLPPPKNKRYNMEQLCRILNINVLRGCLPLDQIIDLIAYLNGDLTDESDDLVDDTQLYFMFVKLAAKVPYISGAEAWGDALEAVTQDYREPIPGAKEKLIRVLRIMLTAWCANRLRLAAEGMIKDL